MTTSEWKRIWTPPRIVGRGDLLDPLTPRQRYVSDQSRARYLRRPDAYAEGVLTGEIGSFENVRFVTSTAVCDGRDMPDAKAAALSVELAWDITTPDGYRDRVRRAFEDAYRSGTGCFAFELKFEGPDL